MRLIVVGVPLTLFAAAVLAAPLLSMSKGAAFELGAILVVSGPTVVGPILAFVRPVERVQRVLAWEGSLIDPVGGILGAVVFHGVLAGTHKRFGSQLGLFLGSVGIGLAGALAGIVVLWLLLRKLRLGEVLGTSAQLAVVIGVAAGCDIVHDEAGLIAAIVMGVAVANTGTFDIPARRPFFETLVQLVIGLLFVSISATITPSSLRHLVLPTLGLVAVLVLVVRPIVATLATARTDLTRGERMFTGWMAPRGIVAAATATTFSATLAAHGVGGAAKILPVTFLVIVATVAIYGLSAAPFARLVGVANPPRTRPLLIGGEPWVVELGLALQSAGLDVLMWAGQDRERSRISQAHLELAPGELLASATGSGAQLEGVTAVLLLTGEDDFNALASTLLEAGGTRRSTGWGRRPEVTGSSRRSPDQTLCSPSISPGPPSRPGTKQGRRSSRVPPTAPFRMATICSSWCTATAGLSPSRATRGQPRIPARLSYSWGQPPPEREPWRAGRRPMASAKTLGPVARPAEDADDLQACLPSQRGPRSGRLVTAGGSRDRGGSLSRRPGRGRWPRASAPATCHLRRPIADEA